MENGKRIIKSFSVLQKKNKYHQGGQIFVKKFNREQTTEAKLD